MTAFQSRSDTQLIVFPSRPSGFDRPSVRILSWLVVWSITFNALAFGQENPPAVRAIEFNRDIRPILSNHCFQCHGADIESRAAGLRLDEREAAVLGHAINLETLEKSELLVRIAASDPSDRMPPTDANKPLTDHQIQLLKQWILEGAEYQEHWAFRPIERPVVPNLKMLEHSAKVSVASGRNEVDAFILQRLQEADLRPASPADRATLIRRASQDVLGLLPTITEADAFINDQSPDAWSKVVDRLLQSPHYGERWGRHWLDQARYADSNGYTIDGPRIMWPYRDWVIASLNRDMPFDQFTIEQLAGDLMPNPTKAQRIATAFHRNTMINEEGGVKPDQFRHEALIDRVSTTGAVWLGLTIGCAQCHSHKFDPVTHDEFYQMYAFFNGATDTNNAGETVEVRTDEMFGWTERQLQQLQELQELRKAKADLETNAPNRPALSTLSWNWQAAKVTAVRASGGAILRIEADSTLLVRPDPAANDTLSIIFQKPDSALTEVASESANGTGVTAVRLRTLPHPSLPAKGPGTANNGNFVLTDFALKVGSDEKRFSNAWADHSQPGYPIEHAIDDKADTGWAINVDASQAARGVRMNGPHEAIFTLADPVEFQDDALTVVLRHDLNKNYLVGHFAIDFSTASVVTDSPDSEFARKLVGIKQRIEALESSLPSKAASVRQMVMKDLDVFPETYVLKRGDFLHPDKEHGKLSPGVPAVLQSSEHGAFSNRLDLARWLVSGNNPLTARVTVNRVWAKYFGRGLVETENDFGFQGTPPTHPELLDWLAWDFMEHGWSLKHLHRTILNSATYKQSSILSQDDDDRSKLSVDPDNHLLSRQTRFRVEAEIVRDQAVAASGLLTEKIGGPGVYLPQPDGIYAFTQNKKDWPTATGPDRFRRTMYTMFYRSAPYPLLSTFDAPDFSTVCTRRARSNTPLQSLTVANDKVFIELAEGLARRVLQDTTLTENERCVQLFRLCLTRHPQQQELDVLQAFRSQQLARFQVSPEEADLFVTRRESDPPVEVLAAWTSVARALFNTDEFVMRN